MMADAMGSMWPCSLRKTSWCTCSRGAFLCVSDLPIQPFAASILGHQLALRAIASKLFPLAIH